MPVYNKLKIAILTILTSHTVSALTLEPIQIQSGAGNLLYAEMKFSNADPNARVEASLAEAEDLISLGLPQHAPGNLNFFTRRASDGTGVIVITSSRPILDNELNILLKIKEGNATHIQQVKTKLNRPNTQDQIQAHKAPVSTTTQEKPLQPQIVVSEKDIALNLPVSAQYAVPAMNTQQSYKHTTTSTSIQAPSAGTPLVINVAPVPQLNPVPHPATTVTAPPHTTSTLNPLIQNVTSISKNAYDTPTMAIVQPMVPQAAPATVVAEPSKSMPKPLDQPTAASEKAEHPSDNSAQKIEKPSKTHTEKSIKPKQDAPAPAPRVAQTEHVVQANESLWKIASRVATQTNQSVPEVMKQIKANNEHAFIGGNMNRIRRGVALNLAIPQQSTTKTTKTQSEQAHAPQKQLGKEKYRINQAEMTLIAEHKQASAQGSAKEKTLQNQTPSELSAKVMTAREKTVKLQKNVSKLTLALQQKDQRIQLLNARLAQLQQQLQQQNRAKKPAH